MTGQLDKTTINLIVTKIEERTKRIMEALLDSLCDWFICFGIFIMLFAG